MQIYIIGLVLGLVTAAYCLKGIIKEAKGAPQKEENGINAWLTPEEREQNTEDANLQQRALDRFLGKEKWEIGESAEKLRQIILGRAFEQYTGNIKEHEGFNVEYTGIEKGVKDMGIDLIAKSGTMTYVIQCKFRASGVINVDVVHQLEGSVNSYRKDKPNEKVRGLLVTTTKLADDARGEAKKLGIETEEEAVFKPIKCKVNDRSEKIYHMPFNKFYDNAKIKRDDELWAGRVKEAKELGFRPAKW